MPDRPLSQLCGDLPARGDESPPHDGGEGARVETADPQLASGVGDEKVSQLGTTNDALSLAAHHALQCAPCLPAVIRPSCGSAGRHGLPV